MFETLCYLLLGVSYIAACKAEKEEEKREQERKRIRDLKCKVFCYAIRHHMLYNDVVKLIQEKKLTFEEIDKDDKEYEGK